MNMFANVVNDCSGFFAPVDCTELHFVAYALCFLSLQLTKSLVERCQIILSIIASNCAADYTTSNYSKVFTLRLRNGYTLILCSAS